MRKINLLLTLLIALLICACKQDQGNLKTENHVDANGYNYQTVTNDPTGLRLYTLDNGLKVYLSRNVDEPKIQTFIAVKAGSSYDPKDNTGLAHYLEHMLFKGTSKTGTLDWEKEKLLLEKISNLYEEHKRESDPKKKLEIYREIDKISLEASNYCVANEYDKMASSIGSKHVNAHTWVDETVYRSKIPSNELEKWLSLESERFSQLVLRLFHTELEAVYEEFNRAQDSEGRRARNILLEGLFPTHPYGQQTTLGKAEHLKNPSMVAIHEYFNKYYVPNNMAVVLVGDLDFDKTIAKVDATFGKFKSRETSRPELPKEKPITAPIMREVFGPGFENVTLAFRSKGANSKQEKLITLTNMILANSQAGLIDLNLNQKKLVQNASCYSLFLKDYGYQSFFGMPKEGQTLEQVRDLLLGQIEKLKKGEFEDWMIKAVVNDLKLYQTRGYENSTSLASTYYRAFINDTDWKDRVSFLDELSKITKRELVDFANEFYGDNYVCVFKRKGQDKSIVKVNNPNITPINLNRDKSSDFLKEFNKKESPDIQPKFVDFSSAIQKTKTNSGIEVSYIKNEINDLFELYIIFDMGGDNDKKLGLALDYIDYLGTDKYSAEEIKKEFYKLGVTYGISSSEDRSYLKLSGLRENIHRGLDLLEHLWANAVSDRESYDKYVMSIDKDRKDMLTSKRAINTGLRTYGKYGENSRLRDIFSIGELKKINPNELVDLFKGLRNYKQRVFYYGKDLDNAISALDKYHNIGDVNNLKEYPEAKKYPELETGKNVYFAQYDMVQAMITFTAKGDKFKAENKAFSKMFNNYFGSGLSSIVFQEMRESRSLAYSAWAEYDTPSHKDRANHIISHIGTQANKMPQAIDAMMSLMNNMPESEKQFNSAKESVLKDIASERITKSNIFWTYERLKKLGIDTDYRQQVYNKIKNMTIEDLRDFFNSDIKGSNYNIMVMGNKKDLNMKYLNKLGKIKEMDPHYLFNYEKSVE
ncbi:M16 family metallopeptidase [Ichthyobacterium seriolicida]|uniref:Zinc protease n=1 Tax=Ichthyobacterium seriolicida TaxID=242600 RepID=A0A1J1E349_9FLAO|nr:M16 family metallopeptidase [Ichthyobacterium seriolicida]BAV94460.1 zinc protease [Ichthyobacterium seriolicida]